MLNSEKTNVGSHLRILDIEIDLASGTVWREDVVIDLPELSFRLLVALVTDAPAMVSKDQLIASVWGDVVVSDETLMQRVRLLRKALGDDSQKSRFIASVRGRGYRLAAAVEEIQQPAVSSHSFPRWKLAASLIGLIAISVIWFAIGPDGGVQPTSIRSLAVLPFDDLSEDKRFGFFADGMHEELLTRLSRLEEVSVLSRTSVERFRNTKDPITEISKSLGAHGIIEGSVRVSDSRLRITVQLIDGARDSHIWAESYEEELTVENVFAIQERVANSIAEALQAEYKRQQMQTLGLPTTNIEAYNLYLLGRYQTFRQTPENLNLAIGYLQDATALDPEFAAAYASLGWAYAFQGTGYGNSRPDAVFPLARAAALRALELDDRLADAHSLYGDILTWYDWDFQLAEVEYKRAIFLDPLNVLGYALFLSSQSRHEEAIEMVNTRLIAEPFDDYVKINVGWNYLRARRFTDAVDMALQVRNHPDVHSLLGFGHLHSGNLELALAAFEEDLRMNGRGQMQLGNLAYAYFKAGKSAIAQKYLEELTEQKGTIFLSPLLLATIYFASGNDERGYELLELAIETRERGAIFLKVSPVFADQRDDPRFIELLKRVGFQVDDS